jgi:hypothetical protein
MTTIQIVGLIVVLVVMPTIIIFAPQIVDGTARDRILCRLLGHKFDGTIWTQPRAMRTLYCARPTCLANLPDPRESR